MIKLSLNGKIESIEDSTCLLEALVQWDFHQTKIAVAINGEFVPRSAYAEKILVDGDKIDIVKPIGGG